MDKFIVSNKKKFDIAKFEWWFFTKHVFRDKNQLQSYNTHTVPEYYNVWMPKVI